MEHTPLTPRCNVEEGGSLTDGQIAASRHRAEQGRVQPARWRRQQCAEGDKRCDGDTGRPAVAASGNSS